MYRSVVLRPGATLLTAAVALAACGTQLPFEPAGPAAAPDPAALGPYPVGVRTIEVFDPRRPKTSTITGERTLRRLVTEVWYPADEGARGGSGYQYRASDFLGPELLARFEDTSFISLATSAVRDAATRPDDRFPLVLFSHGNGGVRMQSTYFTIFLASHGYVVAAPDHEGDTLADFIERDGLNPSDVIGAYEDRALDMRLLIDRFTTDNFENPLPGVVDAERIGISGHSFGALTSLRTSGLDARIKATVAQAPVGHTITWIGVDRPLDSLGIPIMIQTGGLDQTTPPEMHAGSLWENMAEPRYWLSLATAGHFTFSDLCLLDLRAIEEATSVGIGDVIEDGCGPTNLPFAGAAPVLRHFGIGLFNAYLRGSTGTLELLDPARAPSQGLPAGEVTLMAGP